MSEFIGRCRRFNEYGRHDEFGNTSDFGEDMYRQTDEINRILVSINYPHYYEEEKELNQMVSELSNTNENENSRIV